MFKRNLVLPPPGEETFFLWGPRQTGKTTLLRQTYGDARWLDLLKAEEFRRYVARPELLRQEIEAEPAEPGRQIVIDEIQKVPALLDEVHWLLENRGLHFALCGSSVSWTSIFVEPPSPHSTAAVAMQRRRTGRLPAWR